MMRFASKAKELMLRRGVSQETIAQRMGVSQTAVSQQLDERKEDTIPLRRAFVIARILGASLDWMADAEQPMKSDEELELEKDVLKLIARLGLRRSYNRLAKLDETGDNGGGSAVEVPTPPSFGLPPGRTKGATERPGPHPARPRKSRRSSG